MSSRGRQPPPRKNGRADPVAGRIVVRSVGGRPGLVEDDDAFTCFGMHAVERAGGIGDVFQALGIGEADPRDGRARAAQLEHLALRTQGGAAPLPIPQGGEAGDGEQEQGETDQEEAGQHEIGTHEIRRLRLRQGAAIDHDGNG